MDIQVDIKYNANKKSNSYKKVNRIESLLRTHDFDYIERWSSPDKGHKQYYLPKDKAFVFIEDLAEMIRTVYEPNSLDVYRGKYDDTAAPEIVGSEYQGINITA